MSTVAPSRCSTASTAPAVYGQLTGAIREAAVLGSTSGILSWDQETMMPAKGIALRSEQFALLARLHHEMCCNPKIGEWLAACESDKSFMATESVESANVREIRRDYDRERKLPARHVEEFAATVSQAQHVWVEARRESDFASFEPWLARLVSLSRERASCLGIPAGGEAWDALADAYEPGCTAAMVSAVFGPLRTRLVKLIAAIASAPRRPSNRFNEFPLPLDQQAKFVRMVVEQIGFDFSRGRLDSSAHPFCGGAGCNDTRMTTRYSLNCVNDALGSSMHESGHGMYEQGLPEACFGLPSGTAVSLGIHESQSRLWENHVGRSRPFWQWCSGTLASHFGSACDQFSVDELYGACNVVEPGFIRVDADEATYNLHVMVRFELERLLISGKLDTKDLPTEWNRRYKEYLGLDVPDDRRGCLQDVHWSMGAFGYFPTYTLGTLYAAQIYETARRELADLEEGFTRGEFSRLRQWLNREIHAHGRRYLSEDLCKRITGAPLSSDAYFRALEGKLRPLYGL